MKNILITGTGPNGFVGRNLKESLCNKYNIFAPPKFELDLTRSTDVEKYVYKNNISIVIHAAIHVPSINGTDNELENDLLMFFNIERLSGNLDKIIYFGSGAEFDKRYNISLAKETDIGISIPSSKYGLAKYTMNKIAAGSSNIYNLRLFGVFGKYEQWSYKFISNLCCKAMFNLPLTVRKECNFDFLYIDELARVVKCFIESTPSYHDYNVCYGRPYRLTEIAQIVKEISRNEGLEINVLNKDFDLDYTGSNSRLLSEFQDLSLTDMKASIKDLYLYYEKNKRQIDVNTLALTR